MKLRGERECSACGTRWSYFETGEVTCPNCESLRSVAVESARKRHTDSPASLDLSRYRAAVADGADRIDEGDNVEDADLIDVAEDIVDDCRRYLRKRGFIHAGELQPLDDTFLAVHELRAAIADYGRNSRVGRTSGVRAGHATERYLLGLLGGADSGKRPAPDEVPDSLTAARGLACSRAIETYRDELATYLDDNPDPEARRVLERIRDHEKRLHALGGNVPPADAERLVAACRDLYRYLTRTAAADSADGAETALASAADRLNRLD